MWKMLIRVGFTVDILYMSILKNNFVLAISANFFNMELITDHVNEKGLGSEARLRTMGHGSDMLVPLCNT